MPVVAIAAQAAFDLIMAIISEINNELCLPAEFRGFGTFLDCLTPSIKQLDIHLQTLDQSGQKTYLNGLIIWIQEGHKLVKDRKRGARKFGIFPRLPSSYGRLWRKS